MKLKNIAFFNCLKLVQVRRFTNNEKNAESLISIPFRLTLS